MHGLSNTAFQAQHMACRRLFLHCLSNMIWLLLLPDLVVASAPMCCRCYDVTKSIGVYGSPYYNSWYKELEKAAALCPKA